MTEDNAKDKNFLLRQRITRSSILRVIVVGILFALFTIFLSPKLEKVIINNLSQIYRENSFYEVNSLTPIFDMYVYAGDYDLITDTENKSSISNTKFFTMDPRILAMNKFLSNYHSPMAKYSSNFIVEADKQGLDWRLLVSIAGVESAFGNILPRNSNNAWGWRGINGNEQGWSMFASWPEAIEHITQRLANGYGTDLTPFEIEPTYCPPCAENPEHAWANGVTNYMNQLSYYLNNLSQI